MVNVQFCKHNLKPEGEELIRKAKEELTQGMIEIAPCVEECGVCGNGPFALVNGEVVQAESVAELVTKVKEML